MNRTNFYLAICTLSLMTSGSTRFIHAAEKDDLTPEPTVTASAMASITRPTNLMYFDARIVAKGATLRDALKDLRSRRAQFLQEFEKLGADKDSLEFGTTARLELTQPQRSQLQLQAPEEPSPPQQRRESAAGKPVESEVMLRLPIKAIWTLAGADSEQLLLAADDVESKIKAADLGWPKPLERDAATARGRRVPRFPDPRAIPEAGLQPTTGSLFHYGAKPTSEDEQKKLLAEAFQKAQVSAEQLAHAANRRLGDLRTLKAERHFTPPGQIPSSTEPGEVRPQVTVIAVFDLLPTDK